MKRLLNLVIFLNSLNFIAQAQNNTDAQSILDNTTAKLKSSNGISVSFSLTQKDNAGHIVSTTKGILKAKGLKYYVKQDDNEIFCNGTQIWNYDGQNEVTVAKADVDDDELSPQQIVTGFDKKDFDISLISSAGTNYKIELTPVDKRKNFKQVILFINKSTNLIDKASITDKTNAVTEISFNNISLDKVVPDSQFVFDPSKHPGVDVVNQ